MSQLSLFSDAGLADTLTRDLDIAKGMFALIEEKPEYSTYVQIGPNGIQVQQKRVHADGVQTSEQTISPLPLLPKCAYEFQGEYYLHVIYQGTNGRNGEAVVSVQGLVNVKKHPQVKQYLRSQGFQLTADQWTALAPVLRLLLKKGNQDGTLPVTRASVRDYVRQDGRLEPRQAKQRLQLVKPIGAVPQH